MKPLSVIVFIVSITLAILCLATGLRDCVDYLMIDIKPTGAEIAWAIFRVFPLSPFILSLGVLLSGVMDVKSKQ